MDRQAALEGIILRVLGVVALVDHILTQAIRVVEDLILLEQEVVLIIIDQVVQEAAVVQGLTVLEEVAVVADLLLQVQEVAQVLPEVVNLLLPVADRGAEIRIKPLVNYSNNILRNTI